MCGSSDQLLEVLRHVVLLARDDLAVVALVVEGHGVHASVDGAAEQPWLRLRGLPRLRTAVPPLRVVVVLVVRNCEKIAKLSHPPSSLSLVRG